MNDNDECSVSYYLHPFISHPTEGVRRPSSNVWKALIDIFPSSRSKMIIHQSCWLESPDICLLRRQFLEKNWKKKEKKLRFWKHHYNVSTLVLLLIAIIITYYHLTQLAISVWSKLSSSLWMLCILASLTLRISSHRRS